MPFKVVAVLVGLVAALCLWFAYVAGLAGGQMYSLVYLIEDYFRYAFFDLFLLTLWAVTLICGLVLRTKSPRSALALGTVASICGLTATASQLFLLHSEILSFDTPEAGAVWVYVPRLTATAFTLGITLLGLSIQLLFGAPTSLAFRRAEAR